MRIKTWKNTSQLLLCCLPLLAGGPRNLHAAESTENLGDMIFTAGTTATDELGREWAYLSWMATDPSMLSGVQYDIYAKDGDFTSTDPYSLQGSAMLQTDPNSIGVLIGRSIHLGQNTNLLEDTIDQLFAEAVPSDNLPLSEKVAAVINGSLEDAEMYRNLIFMSQAHPALSLAIGRGFACRIDASGITSFEIRDRADGSVVGRVALEAGNPIVLPAPTQLKQITNDSPKGHLNIRLRWSVPDELRRVSLMQFGYNLYRMEKDFAEDPGRGFDVTPPTTDTLLELEQTRPEVKKINRRPIVVDDGNEDPNSWFYVDDNDGLSGGVPFIDGDEFYYFVTALDLLGRDGEVSDGLAAIACDRVAPRVPKDIRTRSLYDYDSGSAVRAVEISWDQDPDFAETAAYYLYRHPTISNMQANAQNPSANLMAGPIYPVTGKDRLAYTNELTAADEGVTYWYTLRAADDAACGPNLSLNSAPVHGGIHDREGPEKTVASEVDQFVETVTASYVESGTIQLGNDLNVELRCNRKSDAIQWVEFYYLPGEQSKATATNAIPLGRFYFEDKSLDVIERFNLPAGKEFQLTFYCRVGTELKTSDYVSVVEFLEGDRWIAFSGDATYGYSTDPDDGPHILIPGSPSWPRLVVDVPPDAGEYRFYRRIDNGPRTLIGQGATSNAVTLIEEDEQAGIVNGGTICYYYQFLDFNGNPGPMTLIKCIEVARTIQLPTPRLEPLESTGTETASPGMLAAWFCAPQGVDRFEVAVHMDQNGYPVSFAPELRDAIDSSLTNYLDVVVNGVTNELGFVTYRTGRLGADFSAPDEALFEIEPPVNLNVEYTLMVRALGPNGEKGPWSNLQSFTWSTVPDDGPDVPWPARGLPPVQDYTFHTNLVVELLDPEVFQGVTSPRVGVRIGEIPEADFSDVSKASIQLVDKIEPAAYLYTDSRSTNDTAFPCVLYRYQIPSPLYPNVSGDVAQVSVMMEEMAWGAPNGYTEIFDPFVAAGRKYNESGPWGLYLLDTHPVARGAAYRYLLVRFGDDGEPQRVIPAGSVQIPE